MTSRFDGSSTPVARALSLSSTSLLAYFQRRLGAQDAADALAEVMVTAWRRADVLPVDDEEARMWLFVVARNVLSNIERGERRRWRLANRLRSTLVAEDAPSADAGAEVRDAISRLEPALAELVRLIHWDGFSVADAAQVLDISASTARSRYQRAKRDLLESLSMLGVAR